MQNDNTNVEPNAALAPASCNSAVGQMPRAIFLCFSMLGLTIGIYVGMSESPIAATVVGSLFGLTGAGGILALLTKTGEDAVSPGRLRDVGKCLSLLCAMSVLGSLFGIAMRNGAIPDLFYASPTEDTLVDLTVGLEDLDFSQHAKLIILQTKLQQLGLPPRENNVILTALRETSETAGSKTLTAAAVARCLQEAQSLQQLSDTLQAKSDALASNAEDYFRKQRETLPTERRNDVDAVLELVCEEISELASEQEELSDIAEELEESLKVVEINKLKVVRRLINAYGGAHNEPHVVREPPVLNRQPPVLNTRHRSWGIKP